VFACDIAESSNGMMRRVKEITMERMLFVDLLAIFFGISSWISINGLWVELPILVNHLPEGWSLPSYLSIIVQIANIGPIAYSLMRATVPHRCNPAICIFTLLLLGCAASLGLVLSWRVTTTVAGMERSTMLFVFVFMLSLVDCTSSVLFLPFIGMYRDIYLNSYLVGEGMSGFIPAITALAQGVGGNPTCQNTSLPNGTWIMQIDAKEPRFSAEDFFSLLLAMMVFSLIAFIFLNWVPSLREERVGSELISDIAESVSSAEPETSPSHIKVDDIDEHLGQVAEDTRDPSCRTVDNVFPLLVLLGIVCFLSNGALPSIQSYSCLPYGNTVYHLAATLNAMANPLMAFLAMFLPCNSPRVVMGLASLGGVATSFIVATALNSPATLLGDLGGGLTVIGWVLVGALFSYVKVSVAGLCREVGALFYCGAATQVGSALGALTAFLLVTQTNLFTAYNVSC